MAIRTLLSGSALLLVLGGGLLSAPASATTLVPLSVEQMTDAADRIVRATVTEVWAEEDVQGQIWTRVQIEVDAILKGGETQALIVDQLGGIYHNDYAPIVGAARFSPGEEAIFFLEQFDSGRLSVVGLFQGKYTVRIDPDTAREMLVRFAPHQSKVYDHRFIPHPPLDERKYVEDMESQILDQLERGWDGTPIPGANTEKLRRINKVQGE